jgi:hypothetical protein
MVSKIYILASSQFNKDFLAASYTCVCVCVYIYIYIVTCYATDPTSDTSCTGMAVLVRDITDSAT